VICLCLWAFVLNEYTVKLGFKELLNKEQIGNSEPFPVTNLPVYLINSEQIGISEQFCDDQNFLNAKFDCNSQDKKPKTKAEADKKFFNLQHIFFSRPSTMPSQNRQVC
jgi:hypothetical protein